MSSQPPARYTGGYNNSEKKDSVKRVGGGGVKTGLPLIITGGKSRFDLFHDNFSGKGRYKKQPRPGEVELNVTGKVEKRDLADKVKFALPRNFCPDCNRTDRMHVQGSINVWTMYDGGQNQEFGPYLKPGEVVITFWCQECQNHEFYGLKIIIPGMEDGPEGLDEWRKKQIRQIRMDRNIADFIRSRVTTGDQSIVVSQEARELFR